VSNWCLPVLWPPGRKPVHVVDLDRDGEPEVVVDLHRSGAHGRRYSLAYRYFPLSGSYRKVLHSWGEVFYELRDLDRDRRPEFVSGDDRFGAAFTSFAGSYYPIRIWRWDHARLVDVTRGYATLIRADERQLWREYLRERQREDPDVRGILAAWLADKYLLGEATDGWRRLQEATRRGDLRGWPTSAESYLKDLRAFLVRTGYS